MFDREVPLDCLPNSERELNNQYLLSQINVENWYLPLKDPQIFLHFLQVSGTSRDTISQTISHNQQ